MMKNGQLTTNGCRTSYVFAILVLSMFIFLSGTFFMTGMAYADDANATRQSATFDIATDVLNLPELAVEGTDLLYSAQMQLKQEGDYTFLELINLGPSQYQEASVVAAIISNDGAIHIPMFRLEDGSFWTTDLNLMNTASLLPLRFTVDSLEQMQASSYEDNLLGVNKRKCIAACLGKFCCCAIYCCNVDGTNCEIFH